MSYVLQRIGMGKRALLGAGCIGMAAALGIGALPAIAADAPEPLPDPSPAAASVELKPIDDKSLTAEIAGRKGKLVLLSLWSKSCPPCIAAYPELVQLGRKYGPKGLEILSINVIDDEKTRREWSLPFLQKQNPPFATFYEEADDDEAFIRAIDPKWYGGLPAEFLYDRQGRRILSMTEDVDMAKLEKLIVQHLEGTVESKRDPAMAELRAFVEGKGGTMTWDSSTRTVGVTIGSQTLTLRIGSRNAEVDGKTVVMDRPSAIEDGRTVVSRSFLESALQGA